MFYRNNKTKKVYDTLSRKVIDANNNNDGKGYSTLYRDSDNHIFIREDSEFLVKFHKVTLINTPVKEYLKIFKDFENRPQLNLDL